MNNFQYGTVTDNTPDSQGRIQVEIDWPGLELITGRFHMLVPCGQRENFELPENDDLVVVATSNEDLTQGIVLGILWRQEFSPFEPDETILSSTQTPEALS